MNKHIIPTAIATATILTFSGCFGGKTYVHPNYTPQKWAMDKAECNAFARGAYGYNQPYQIQDNNKQYVVNGSSFSNNGVSTNYYGTIKQQPTMNQNINNLAQGMMNVRYTNNINEAIEACLFQKGWRLEGEGNRSSSNVKYDVYGYDQDGYHYNGWHRSNQTFKATKTKYDNNGYDVNGYDKDGYYREGFNKEGLNRLTRTKYDEEGFTKEGYNKDGKHYTELTKLESKYNSDGYDKDGYNADGYDKDGYDWDGYNKDGYDRKGIHMSEKFKNN